MTYSVEYIVQTASFEHVLWKVQADDIVLLESQLDLMSARLLEKMGRMGALSKGAVSYGYANPDSGQSSEVDTVQPDAMELIKSELGGKVLETTQKAVEQEPGPVAQPVQESPSEAPSRPWKRQPETKQKKEWESDKPAATAKAVVSTSDLDDFFD